MGTPIEPPEPGIACPLCWGSAGSPFGSGAPPDILQVEVTGIQKGTAWIPADGEPPEGVFSVEPVIACQWFSLDFPKFFIFYTSGQSWLQIEQFFPVLAFFAQPAIDCVQDFVNELTNPAGKFFNGSAHVFV